MLCSGLDASPLEGSRFSYPFWLRSLSLIPFSEVCARLPRLGTPSPGCVAAAGVGRGPGRAPGSFPLARRGQGSLPRRCRTPTAEWGGGSPSLPGPRGPERPWNSGREDADVPPRICAFFSACSSPLSLLALLPWCHSGFLELCLTKQGAVGSVCHSRWLQLLRPHGVWESPSARV